MTKLHKAFLAVAVTAVITTMTGFIPAASAAPQESKKITHIGLMVCNGKERKAGRGKNRRNS